MSNSILGMFVKGIIKVVVMAVFVFGFAGRLDYWQGWLFNGINLLGTLLAFIVFLKKPDLLKERLKPGPGVKHWDKIWFYGLYLPAFFAILIIGCLDAGRFRWSAQIPAYIYILSCLIVLAAAGIGVWALKVNDFFSSMVSIQTDRGHRVVQEGPYSIVRHPAYSVGIVSTPGYALILGSLWALIPTVVIIVLFIFRTYMEDITLQKELAGYTDYARKVRYRLIPGIW